MPQYTTSQKRAHYPGGLNSQEFFKFCDAMAAVLTLPGTYINQIAKALSNTPRLPVIWLAFQEIIGETESFLRATRRPKPPKRCAANPPIVDLLLDIISLDYHETSMAPASPASELALWHVLQTHPGKFVCIVEGAIPMTSNGAHLAIRRRTALSLAREVLPQARATIAIGPCISNGNPDAVMPQLPGAVSIRDALPGLNNLICLPSSPADLANIVATLVHLITFDELPPVDSHRRPYFALAGEIHEEGVRHDHDLAKSFPNP